jgi:adenylate cyclase class 2
MEIEYEATFVDIDKVDIRKRLTAANAELVKKEFLQKRTVYSLPKSVTLAGGWARVRDEGDIITLSIKSVDGDQIHNQKEIRLQVDSFQEAVKLLEMLGCQKKAYQETKRELWILDDVEVTIDTWPFLESFIEVEGASESVVKEVSIQLGFDWRKAKFCAVDQLYVDKYGITHDKINNKTEKIIFEMGNPFLSMK